MVMDSILFRVSLLAAACVSLAACTPSTEPLPEPAATTVETTTPAAPASGTGMPSSDASTQDANNPNVPGSDAPTNDETPLAPADHVREADPATGVSAPAPPPIEDPAPEPLPTH